MGRVEENSGEEFIENFRRHLSDVDEISNVVLKGHLEVEGHLEVKENHRVDVFGHGTAVASILHEMAPEAEIGSFRVLDFLNQSQSEMICCTVPLGWPAA